VAIEAVTTRLRHENARQLLADVDVVVDGTDNLATRYLINEVCVAAGVPWVYGGIAGVHGLVMPILVGRGPCLRCVFTDGPPERELPTSEGEGVFGPTPAVIGALEAAQAMRILTGDVDGPVSLLSINVWTGESDRLTVKRAPDCPTCGEDR
jgi:molybdopterin-synthase adenylyltransferase